MAKKKGKIQKVVETVESWVGMEPKATKKNAPKAAKRGAKKKAKTAVPPKTNTAAKKKAK